MSHRNPLLAPPRWAACLLLIAAPALAAPRILTAAAGDCDDADLRAASRFFSDVLKDRVRDQVMDSEVASRQLKPRPSKSREEIQRQLGSAQTQFYNLQYAKANQQVDDALKDVETLPPGGDRWSLYVGAQLLRGIIKLGARQTSQAEEAFRKILSLDPSYKLDPDYYSPSTRAAFDKVRKDVASESKVSFQVRSNPAGADVFLDGFNIGRSPLNAKLVPAKYQMVLLKNGLTSFPRWVTVGNTASVHVDLEFEGSVRPGQPICIAEQSVRNADRIGNAVKLGAMLGVEEVALVRVLRQSAGAQWVTASLVNVRGGNEVREGGLKMDVSGSPNQIGGLVSYIATGQTSPEVVVMNPSKESAWARGTARPEPIEAGAKGTNGETPAGGSVTAETPAPRGGLLPGGIRQKAWIPAAAGGVLVGTGVVFFLMAKGVENALITHSPSITNPDQAVSSGKTYQTLSTTSWILGAAGLGAAGAMYFLDPAPPTPKVSLVPFNGGAMATLGGTWQ